jgi:osmotically-inducible protein OsmY
MAEHWDRERERGRRYRGGEGYYGGYYGYPERERDYERGERRGDDRGFFERAGDEVRSWFGDDEAQRRRTRDDRERGGDSGWWSGRDREEERRWGGRADDVEREWARRWGYIEGRGNRGSGERPTSWGYAGGYVGGRPDWWSGSGGYEPSDWTGGERSGERWSSGRGSWAEGRQGVSSGPYVGRGPRGYHRSDERIHEDVCERLSRCGDLDASDIEVRVTSGEVTLQGTVRERHDKRLAEDLIETVSGVREVNNQIRVSQPAEDVQPQQPSQPRDPQRYRIA